MDTFNQDALTYRTASNEVRLQLEEKWGERACYFKPEDTTDYLDMFEENTEESAD